MEIPFKSRIIIVASTDCELQERQYELRKHQRGISWGLDFENDSSKGVAFFSATKKPAFLSAAAAAAASYVVRGKARDLDSVQTSGCQAQCVYVVVGREESELGRGYRVRGAMYSSR